MFPEKFMEWMQEVNERLLDLTNRIEKLEKKKKIK